MFFFFLFIGDNKIGIAKKKIKLAPYGPSGVVKLLLLCLCVHYIHRYLSSYTGVRVIFVTL